MRTLCLSQPIGVLLIHTEDIIQSCLKVQGKITMATHSYKWRIFIMNICNAMQYCRQRMNLMETVGYKIVKRKYYIIFFWCLKPFLVLVYDPLHYVNLCHNALQYKLPVFHSHTQKMTKLPIILVVETFDSLISNSPS